jgi:hypothetical protein
MKLGRFLAVALLLTGCAGVANFPPQPTQYWGFRSALTIASDMESITRVSSKAVCG